MGIVSFVESSFFPIPPDAMLIPMAIARPDKAWFYATVCTITSVAGGVLGYFIGAMLYDSVGLWLIQLYGYGNKVEAFREAYAQWGGWIILLKGLTPIPYKIVTIASGFAGYNLLLFVLLSIVARGIAFSSWRFCSTAMARRRVRSSRSDWGSGSLPPRCCSSPVSLPPCISSEKFHPSSFSPCPLRTLRSAATSRGT